MQQAITINGTRLHSEELPDHCRQMLVNPSLSEWEKDVYSFCLQWLDSSDHILVHTSGSTGAPKSICLQKSWMKYSALQTCRFFDLNQNSSALLCLPVAYIAGKMMIVRAMVAGFNLILREPTGAPFSDPQESFDFAAITPMQLHQNLPFLQKYPVVQNLIVGGGEIRPTLEEETQNVSAAIYSTYGMTETSSHIALRRVNGPEREDHFTVLGHTKITTDNRGCMVLENPELFQGQLITNDLAELISPNRFRWLGRYDNIINSGGIKVIPEEVEQRLSPIVPCQMAVTSVPDEKLGEMIILVTENCKLTEPNEKKILAAARELLPAYSLPRKIISIGQIPRTPNGKTDRRRLKQYALKIIYP